MRDEQARGVVKTEPFAPSVSDFKARRRIIDAQEQERREIEQELEKPTTSGKARNPFSFLASQKHKQQQALLSLGRKPATAPAAKPEQPKSKTLKIGGVILAGSITEKIGGANR